MTLNWYFVRTLAAASLTCISGKRVTRFAEPGNCILCYSQVCNYIIPYQYYIIMIIQNLFFTRISSHCTPLLIIKSHGRRPTNDLLFENREWHADIKWRFSINTASGLRILYIHSGRTVTLKRFERKLAATKKK